MIELSVYNSRTYFSGKESELKRMFKRLRVKDPNSFFKTRAIIKKIMGAENLTSEQKEERAKAVKASEGWIKFYSRRNDTFQTGLIFRVKKYLRKREIPFKIIDYRKPEVSLHPVTKFRFVDGEKLRPEQMAPLNSMIEKRRGIIHLATNAGKTEVVAALIGAYKEQQRGQVPRTLFLVHRQGLAIQAVERFQTRIGEKAVMIGAGRKKIPVDGILVSTVQTANNLLKTSGFKSFLSRCEILVIDEFHVNKSAQLQRVVNLCGAGMRFGLSGTIAKKNDIKMMHFRGLTGPIISEIRNKELVDLGRSARPIMRLVEPPSDDISGLSYGGAYNKGIVHSKGRNKTVVRETLRYLDKGRHVLITVGRIAHGNILRHMLQQVVDVPIEFIRGNTPLFRRLSVKKAFIKGKLPILIASPIFDVGEDLPGGVPAWINAAAGKGWELVLQRLGRVLRQKSEGKNFVYITDFLDFHNEYLAKHSMARFEYYKDEKIAKIKIIRRKDV